MSAIDDLISSVTNHKVVNNEFYTLWTKEQLSVKQVMVFAKNFYAWTYNFPHALSAIIFSTNDPVIRAEYTKTLYSEMGHGNPGRIHSVLFKAFANDLIVKLGGESGTLTDNPYINETDILPETLKLNQWEIDTYSKNLVIACGAQLAIEWQAYTMIRKLYQGACRYADLWPQDDSFFESAEFFYSHLGEAEKEHKEESYKASKELLNLGVNFDDFQHGFNEHLNKIAKFWEAIATEVQRVK